MPIIGISRIHWQEIDLGQGKKEMRPIIKNYTPDEYIKSAFNFQLPVPPEFSLLYDEYIKHRHAPISVSSLDGCPRRTVLQAKTDWFIPETDVYYFFNGSAIHTLYEKGTLDQQSIELLQIDTPILRMEAEIDVEETFNLTINGQPEEFKLTGHIDKIYVLKDGSIVLADLKTNHHEVSKGMQDAPRKGYVRQINHYRYLLRNKYPSVKDIRLYNYALNGWFGKLVKEWTSKDSYDDIIKRLTYLVTAMKAYPSLPSVEDCWGSDWLAYDVRNGAYAPYLCCGWKNRPQSCPFWNEYCKKDCHMPYKDWREIEELKKGYKR